MPRIASSNYTASPATGNDDDVQAPHSRRARHTRERILQAAREQVMEGGASRLTLDAVVARAGLSKGAFLYHFKTKRDLLVTLIEDLIRAFDAVQADHERRFAGDPDPWLSSQVASFPNDEMLQMGAALLAAIAEDPTLLEPLRDWYRRAYERVRTSPRTTDIAAIVMLVLDGIFIVDLLGLPTLEPVERRHLLRTLQALAAGDLELVPLQAQEHK